MTTSSPTDYYSYRIIDSLNAVNGTANSSCNASVNTMTNVNQSRYNAGNDSKVPSFENPNGPTLTPCFVSLSPSVIIDEKRE